MLLTPPNKFPRGVKAAPYLRLEVPVYHALQVAEGYAAQDLAYHCLGLGLPVAASSEDTRTRTGTGDGRGVSASIDGPLLV